MSVSLPLGMCLHFVEELFVGALRLPYGIISSSVVLRHELTGGRAEGIQSKGERVRLVETTSPCSEAE